VNAVNSVCGLSGRNYAEKCAEIGLKPLEERRWEQDMVQAYKIINGVGNIRYERFFEKNSGETGFAHKDN
jgi:hypothetical protein